MNGQNRIVIVGAGAAGLMATRELVRAGKKVTLLESRGRLGGRIFPLPRDEFGYPAEGGAEFVHGRAELTRSLIGAAGLHYVPIAGEAWRWQDGDLVPEEREVPYLDRLIRELGELKNDVPVATFLEKHFADGQYTALRTSILNMIKGYDAADPARASALALRDELSKKDDEGQQGRIKEGYAALIEFLAGECRRFGCEIELNCRVRSVAHEGDCKVLCDDGRTFKAEAVIVTVPLPLIGDIEFSPAIPRKLSAARQIGFGSVIKIIIHFHNRWWIRARARDLTRLTFLFSDDVIPTWWTQFPQTPPTLTGWIAGPDVEQCKDNSLEDIANAAFGVLSNIFATPQQTIRENCVVAKVLNWSADPFARGAYSYATVNWEDARRELLTTANNSIFFAGEALAEGTDASTVEGAIRSGHDVAMRILMA